MVDFPASLEKGSFCAKACVSEELDELRRKLNGLPDLLQIVAEEEKERLPKEVGACVVSYIPHVGYLVAMPIKRALQEQGFDHSESESLGGKGRKETRKKYDSTISCPWGELSSV